MKRYIIFIFAALLSINANAFGVELSSPEVQKLYDISDNYHTEGKYKQALEQLDLALAKAKERNAQSDIAVILGTIGTVYQINLGQLEKALINYDQALIIFRKMGEESKIALVLSSIGGCYLDLNRMEIAISKYKEAIEIHNKLGNEKQATLNFIGMGTAYLRLGQRDKAKKMFGEALFISQKNSDEITMAMSRAAMADIFAMEGEFDQALKHYEESLAVMRKTGNEVMISVYLSNLGDIYLKKKQFKKALKYFDEVHEINKRLKNNQVLLGVLFGSGQAHSNLNHPEKAIEKFSEAFEISRKMGVEYYTVLSARNMSMNYFRLKNFSKSIEFSRQAIKLIKKEGRELDAVQNLSVASELGIISSSYWGLKEDEKAIDYQLQALEIYKKVGSKSQIAWSHESLGMIYSGTDQQMMSLDSFGAALKVYRELGNDIAIGKSLVSIGVIYRDFGGLNKAMGFFNDAIQKYKGLNDEIAEANTLSEIAVVFETRGQYKRALEIYKKIFDIYNKYKNDKKSLSSLNSMGGVYQHMGEYGKAMKIFKKYLGFLREKGPEELINFSLRRIGDIHKSWGQIEKALEYYEESIVFAKKYNDEISISLALTSIGNLYSLREYDKALEIFGQAAEINKRYGSKIGLANSYMDIGRVNVNLKKYRESLDKFNQGLRLYREIGAELSVATAFYEIGGVYLLMGQQEKALINLKRSLEIRRRGGGPKGILESLYFIGLLYYGSKNYPLAVQNFIQAVEIAEKLRKTATGNARRDYLIRLIPLYKLLATAYLKNGEFSKSFSMMEQGRSRLLLDKLLNKNFDLKFPSVKQIQANIDDDSALVAFNRHNNKGLNYESVELFVITKNDYQGHIVSTETLQQYYDENKQSIKAFLESQKGILSASNDTVNILDVFLHYYRFLMTRPSEENEVIMKKLSRELYDLLIGPGFPQIKNKKKLIVIPDEALGFIPFETLRSEDGRYLIENFDVAYTQSMSIFNVIKNRNYPDSRKSMLAFGDAVYDSLTYNVEPVKNAAQLAYLNRSVLDEQRDDNYRSVGEAFSSLGYGPWSNLPGTKTEVEGINSIIKDATVLTGDSVTENKIKEMSENGELSKFKVIHLATHGLTVPEFPELSSIVLSQFKDNKETEDGYLRISEISDLRIEADFVNLSACETGLGKLYAGEGVVGLTSAFLLAGANGLSASLWNVADKSTAVFMTGMYQLVEQKGMTYPEAINEMKRQFIKGKVSLEPNAVERGMKIVKDIETDSIDISHPFYWAPFVYYGRN